MADIKYMKAVEWDKLSASFKKTHSQRLAAQYGMWLQRKYDGCYGEAVMSDDGDRMLSREGLDYTKSCAHILRAIRKSGFVRGSLIGEVYKQGVPFSDISGRFRRQKQGEQDVDFVLHDLKSHEEYFRRWDMLNVIAQRDWPLTILTVAETYRNGEWDGDPMEWALKWKAEGGYDGAILRDPNAAYTPGLVKEGEIVKVKPVLSLDLMIRRIHCNPGAITRRNVFTIDVTYRGVTTTVGSGVPHDGSTFTCGDIAQIDSMGLTEDGRLREPRFIIIRHDKRVEDQ